jgi:hypothetical protein
MSRRYTYSKTVGNETFTAVEFDSFDEAVQAVEKGISQHQVKKNDEAKAAVVPTVPESDVRENMHPVSEENKPEGLDKPVEEK